MSQNFVCEPSIPPMVEAMQTSPAAMKEPRDPGRFLAAANLGPFHFPASSARSAGKKAAKQPPHRLWAQGKKQLGQVHHASCFIMLHQSWHGSWYESMLDSGYFRITWPVVAGIQTPSPGKQHRTLVQRKSAECVAMLKIWWSRPVTLWL